jgi:hypothetical protein
MRSRSCGEPYERWLMMGARFSCYYWSHCATTCFKTYRMFICLTPSVFLAGLWLFLRDRVHKGTLIKSASEFTYGKHFFLIRNSFWTTYVVGLRASFAYTHCNIWIAILFVSIGNWRLVITMSIVFSRGSVKPFDFRTIVLQEVATRIQGVEIIISPPFHVNTYIGLSLFLPT